MKTKSSLPLPSKLARGKATQNRIPRTKLKRHPKKTVEVEKKPLLIAPKELGLHPLLGRIGMLSDLIQRETEKGNKDGEKRHAHKAKAESLAEELASIRESIRNEGIKDALKVCKSAKGKWLILDGRHRWELAGELSLETVPCYEYPEAEARTIIMAAAVRRHVSKGARAYQAITFYPEVVTEEKRGGDRSKTSLIEVLTAEALAVRTGVSKTTMETAIWLYKAFAEREDARLKFEASIYIGNALNKIKGAVQAFLAGDTEADPERDERPDDPSNDKLIRCQMGLNRLFDTWQAWDKMKPPHQESAITMLCMNVKKSPAAVREALRQSLAEEDES